MNRQTLLVAAVAAAAALAFGVAAATLDSGLPSPAAGDTDDTELDGNGGGTVADEGSSRGGACQSCVPLVGAITTTGLLPPIPPSLVLAVAVLGGLVAAVLWLGAGRGRGGSVTAADEPTDGIDAADDGRGSASPTFDQPPASNAVYRVWTETFAGVGSGRADALTPGERADLACERGWDEDAVETLTAVFRRVRYGTARPTGERVERAHEAAERLDEEGAA